MVFTGPFAKRFAAFCCGLLTACAPLAPATAPPQLSHTPGAYVAIANGHFNAGSFQFDYPASWRLITLGAASDHGLHIVLQAPSGGELSIRMVETESDADGEFIRLAKGGALLATAKAAGDSTADLAAKFDQIIRSIRS